MNSTQTTSRTKSLLIRNSPLLGIILIVLYTYLLETPFLERFRDETTFALILVIFVPMAILLGITQIYFWFKAFAHKSSPLFKRTVELIFLGALTAFAGIILVRWTL